MARSAASIPVRLLMPGGSTMAESRLRTTWRSIPSLAIATESLASWLQAVEQSTRPTTSGVTPSRWSSATRPLGT